MESWQFWLGFAGIFVTIIAATVRITNSLATANAGLTALVNLTKTELTNLVYQKFNEARADIDNESADLRHEFGETLKALKAHVESYEEKLYKVELYIRDNYIEVPTFNQIIKDLKDDIEKLSGKLDKLLERNVKFSR